MTSPTARLGLVANADAVIDTNESNWARVDSAAGLIVEANGAPAPVGVLYDGAIVVNKNTKVSYRIAGPSPYTYVPFTVPMTYKAHNSGSTTIPASSSVNMGWPTFDANLSLQCSAAANQDSATKGFKCTMKGIYLLTFYARFTNGGGSTRTLRPTFNGSPDTNWEMMQKGATLANQTPYLHVKLMRALNVGDIVAMILVNNDTTDRVTDNNALYAALVNPVP